MIDMGGVAGLPRNTPPALAAAREESLTKYWKQEARFDRVARVLRFEELTTSGTILIKFSVVDDGPFAFQPGQFISIPLEDSRGFWQSPYAMMSAPNEKKTFDLLVKVVPDGHVARYLGSLVPGDDVAFRGPIGRVMCPPEDGRDLALFATGVGVGPFLGLAYHLLGHGFERGIRLFWGLRTEQDICLTKELDGLATRYRNFSYELSLSKPSMDWPGRRGRITEWAPQLIGDMGRYRFYLCGNGAMVEEMAGALSEAGVTMDLVYGEPYFKRYYRPDPIVVSDIARRFRPSSQLVLGLGDGELFPIEQPVNRTV